MSEEGREPSSTNVVGDGTETLESTVAHLRRSTVRLGHATHRVGRAIFGDRRGLVVFLGCVCVASLYWRAGVFINDTATLVRTLEALADGRLWIDRASSNHFNAPGAVVTDGYVYGRNYGQVLLSLPILWTLEAVAHLADLRVALTALWHLALLGFVHQVGRLLDARRLAIVGGSSLVLGSFVLNLVLATQFLDVSRPLLALQIGTILATGLLAVLTYRLVARRHGTAIGVTTGVAAAIVLPVGFWASFPKRHVLVALLLVCVLYCFARSRNASTVTRLPVVGHVPVYRPLAYGFVGLLAWVHAAEGLFAFLALAAVDLPTAPSNDRRTLAAIAVTFGLSLVPVLATNALISGDPSVAPRMLTPASGADEGAGLSSQFASEASTEIPVVSQALRVGSAVLTQVLAGLGALTDLDRVAQTWVRSGSPAFLTAGRPEFAGSNLTVLESIPVFGAFAALLASVGSRLSEDRSVLDGIEATDVLAICLTVVFLVLYAHRLPTHVQITVRYLLPIYPLLLYLLVRQAVVRRLLAERRRLTAWTYTAAVLLGTQLVLASVVIQQLPVAAAVQLHALLGLGAAAFLAAAVVAARIDERAEPVAAVALGLAAAAGTAFVLLTGMAYFSFVGEHVLPISDAVAELIGRI